MTYLDGSVNLPFLQRAVDLLHGALAAYQDAVGAVIAEIGLDEARRFGDDTQVVHLPYADQRELLEIWRDEVDRLQEMLSYNDYARRLLAASLEPVIQIASGWVEASRSLVTLFDRAWYESVLENAFAQFPELTTFEGEMHNRCAQMFRDLDTRQFAYNRARLAALHWDRLPRSGSDGQMGVLQREFEKKRRHYPIRKLMRSAFNAVQSLKPVFMMSPLSIAMYLPPGTVTFDLVVFDEASQVKPADALGAVLRGRQVVVTGDQKQLPPTSFFEQIVDVADSDDESPTADMESILGLFAAQGARQKMLRWHYRSRHESLIAVSNYEFYDNELVVFPSPDHAREYTGLFFHHLPDTYYDRGRSRTNRGEALKVAQAVMEHARLHPRMTLGVAAFSVSQMNEILDQLEHLRRQNPGYESFFSNHQDEPFFVKNLENVQGDERDVMFISVGYGRSADRVVNMSFGPLNNDGGERRLNVLITRARYRCEVFSNITGDDIDLRHTKARGVVALKRFLKYAQTADLDIPTVTGREPDSPFEEDVISALRQQGLTVDPQVGSAGFYIDLAVVDDDRPGRYLLGVECDGATYHRARSARDRDRLRQEVLEGLGWRIHRIWSTDWFSHRDREIGRVLESVTQARASKPSHPTGASPSTPKGPAPASPTDLKETLNTYSASRTATEIRRAEQRTNAPTAKLRRYEQAKLRLGPLHDELHEISPARFARWVTDVVKVESPIHIDELTRRITYSAGVKRAGSRIQQAIRAGVAQAAKDGQVVTKGDFVWSTDMERPPVRDRSNLPITSRKIDLVAPEEIAEAIKAVVRSSMGVFAEDLPAAACTRLGFARTGALIAEAVESVMDRMMTEGVLMKQNGYVVLGESE